MKKIKNSLANNDYIGNCEDTVFSVLLRDPSTQIKHKKFSNRSINNFYYIHSLLKYPPRWKPDTDIFQFINKESIVKLQKNQAFFVFDSSTEGFSPIYDFPFFDMLYYNCKKYNVDHKMIIYVSSNLRDEHNLQNYCTDKNLPPINVFSFLSFEQVIAIDDKRKDEEAEEQYKRARDSCNANFQDKYFSSLSRVNRPYRALATFLLSQSKVSNNALISHDNIDADVIKNVFHRHEMEYNVETIKTWCNRLPLTVDQTDFNQNWAINTSYTHLHDQTLFQIVNETLVDSYHNTSLFYSEKSFRPIACFQPMIIYGQQGCNKYLEKLGYKTYHDWFDLGFDDEPDNIVRYQKILKCIEDICSFLDKASKSQKIEWRFQRADILKHNFKNMISSNYSKLKLRKFIKRLSKRCI